VQRESFTFSRAWGDERARPIHFLRDWPARNFKSAVCDAREEFWSRHESESETRAIRDAAGSQRIRARRFDFMDGFYALFYLTLVYFLDYLLNFRDDLPGAASPRGLTAWHLNHRAGLAPQERAPRPS